MYTGSVVLLLFGFPFTKIRYDIYSTTKSYGNHHPKAFADFAAASSRACLGSFVPL
jgi:hypothetical protein